MNTIAEERAELADLLAPHINLSRKGHSETDWGCAVRQINERLNLTDIRKIAKRCNQYGSGIKRVLIARLLGYALDWNNDGELLSQSTIQQID